MSFEEVQVSQARRVNRVRAWMRRLTLLLVFVAVVGIGAFYYARSRVAIYTAEKPVALPKVQVSKDRMVALEKRIGTISSSVDAGSTLSGEFILTSEEINALIHKEPKLRDKVFIEIIDQQLTADVSFPADVLPGGEGRYFNAKVKLNVSVAEGMLQVFIQEALVDDAPVPELWMKLVRERNFAKPLYNDSEISQILENIEAVKIENDAVRFQLRGSANEKQVALQARHSDRRHRLH